MSMLKALLTLKSSPGMRIVSNSPACSSPSLAAILRGVPTTEEHMVVLFIHLHEGGDIQEKQWKDMFTSPPIGGGRGIVMPMSVCLFVCLFVCVFVCVCVCLFVRVFAKFQSVISQPFLNRSL